MRWSPVAGALVSALLLIGCSSLPDPNGDAAGGDTTAPPSASTTTTRGVFVPGAVLPPAVNRPYMGVSVPMSQYELLSALEADIGHRIELLRWFRRWDDNLDHPGVAQALAEGRRVHLSVRPAGGGGLVIPWRELATAEPGSPIHAELEAWVDRMITLPEGSYVTLNHEPETRESAANGDADDFVAMWRQWVSLLRERGGDHLVTVWIMTGGAFNSDLADRWYPGDDVVDVVGVDPYNWFTCQGSDRPWTELEELLARPLDFARRHGKRLAVSETASVEDPAEPGRKATWIRNATAFLQRPEVRDDLEYVSWFNVTAPGGTWPDCVWDYNTSSSSAEAFSEMVAALADG